MHGKMHPVGTPPPLAERRDFRLGAAVVRPARHRLEAGETLVSLEPQVMRVLLALADAGGAVLSRAALLDGCWPGVMVSDDALNRAIAEIRRAARALGDPFAIETLPRTGYRVVGEVRPLPEATEPKVPPPHVDRRWLLATGLAGAGALGLGLWSYRRPAVDPALADMLARAKAEIDDGGVGGVDSGVATLDAAVRRFPDSAAAWGQLAMARALEVEFSRAPRRDPDVAAAAAAVDRALALDGGQPDALTAATIVHPTYAEWRRHEQRLLAVVAAHPRHIQALSTLGILQLCTGQAAAAFATLSAAVQAAPGNARVAYRRILAGWAARGVDAAIALSATALQRFPDDPLMTLGRLFPLMLGPHPEQGIAYAEDATRTHAHVGYSPRALHVLRLTATALAGRRPADLAAAITAQSAAVTMGHFQVVQALLFLPALGGLDMAFDVAQLHFLGRGPLAVDLPAGPALPPLVQPRRLCFMLWVPSAAPMRRDPRFAALVRDLGLADFWRATGHGPDPGLLP